MPEETKQDQPQEAQQGGSPQEASCPKCNHVHKNEDGSCECGCK